MSSMPSDVTSDDKLWAFLAYIFTPLSPIVILLMADKKDRPFIKAHNVQALVWGVFNIVVGGILSTVLFFCLGAPAIIIWAVGVYWGYQAYQGKRFGPTEVGGNSSCEHRYRSHAESIQKPASSPCQQTGNDQAAQRSGYISPGAPIATK